ncbi:unnamed protein product, partial [Closterium sp. NIES-54]
GHSSPQGWVANAADAAAASTTANTANSANSAAALADSSTAGDDGEGAGAADRDIKGHLHEDDWCHLPASIEAALKADSSSTESGIQCWSSQQYGRMRAAVPRLDRIVLPGDGTPTEIAPILAYSASLHTLECFLPPKATPRSGGSSESECDINEGGCGRVCEDGGWTRDAAVRIWLSLDRMLAVHGDGDAIGWSIASHERTCK